MDNKKLIVYEQEWKVARSPYILITNRLMGCAAIALYSPKEKIGGLAHASFSKYNPPRKICGGVYYEDEYPKEYLVEEVIPTMIKEMTDREVNKNTIYAKIAGGDEYWGMHVVKAAKEKLIEEQIKLKAEDVGSVCGVYQRSVEFHLASGKMVVRHQDEKGKEIRNLVI